MIDSIFSLIQLPGSRKPLRQSELGKFYIYVSQKGFGVMEAFIRRLAGAPLTASWRYYKDSGALPKVLCDIRRRLLRGGKRRLCHEPQRLPARKCLSTKSRGRSALFNSSKSRPHSIPGREDDLPASPHPGKTRDHPDHRAGMLEAVRTDPLVPAWCQRRVARSARPGQRPGLWATSRSMERGKWCAAGLACGIAVR